MIVHRLRRPHSICVRRTITHYSAYAAHAGHQLNVGPFVRGLHHVNDEAPDVIDLLSIVRLRCDPEVGILVLVPRRLKVETQGYAWEFAGNVLYDPLGNPFDVLVLGHGYGLGARALQPAYTPSLLFAISSTSLPSRSSRYLPFTPRMRGARSVRCSRFLLADDGTELVSATTHSAFCDPDTQRPKRIPRQLLDAYTIVSPQGPHP